MQNFRDLVKVLGLLAIVLAVFLQVPEANACLNEEECADAVCPGGPESIRPLCNPQTYSCYCGPQSCGNGSCQKGENFSNCPNDCVASCGNGFCDAKETSLSCPADCVASCGNGLCDAGESVANCQEDCGVAAQCCEYSADAYGGYSREQCVQYCSVCGNGVCEVRLGEDSLTCSSDCGVKVCGDGKCDERIGEDAIGCPEDCFDEELLKCEESIDCLKLKGCNYVEGQKYPLQGEQAFTVCSCVGRRADVRLCELSVIATGVCGDNFCDGTLESCVPTSAKFCEKDCQVCPKADVAVEIEEIGETREVNAGDIVEVKVIVENYGAADSEPAKVRIFRGEMGGKPLAEFEVQALYITSVQTRIPELLVHLAEARVFPQAFFSQEKSLLAEKRQAQMLLFQATSKKSPTAVLKVSPESGKAPLRVVFDVSESRDEDGRIIGYELDRDGDGTFEMVFDPSIKNVEHTYEQPGIYKARLKVTDDAGQTNYAEAKVLALERPLVKVVSIDTKNLCGKVKFFIVVETGNEDFDKSNNVKELTLDIKCRREPKAIITIFKLSEDAPVEVRIDALKSFDPDGEIKTVEWILEDGSKSNDMVVVRRFEKKGQYKIKLKVVDNEGLESVVEEEIVIGKKPAAVFSLRPAEGKAPLKVTLDASASDDADGQILGYKWEFGKDEIVEGKTVEYVFAKNGIYAVKLKVIDNDGIVEEYTKQMTVGLPPKPAISLSAEKAFVGQEIMLDAGGTLAPDAQVEKYDWDLGDGTQNKGEVVNHVYSEPGVYNVRLKTSDVVGLAAEEKATVKVYGAQGIDIAIMRVETEPKKVIQDMPFKVRATVRNIGDLPSEAFIVELRKGTPEGEKVAEANVPALDALEKLDISLQVEGDDLLGEQKYFIISDQANKIGESNKNNNVVEAGIIVNLEEICGNAIDDNLDGFVDGGCIERCGNRTDDDGDNAIDEGCGEICANGRDFTGNALDDDKDGKVDEDCGKELLERCGNDEDDNFDGLVDEGCVVEVCGNKADDNQNGKIDEGCEFTNAVIVGEPLRVYLAAEEVSAGQTQEVSVEHPFVGAVKGAKVILTYPSGRRLDLLTDEKGSAKFKAEESGSYSVAVRKYTLAENTEFVALSSGQIFERTLVALPTIVFTDRIYTQPLLIILLLLLAMIAAVMASERVGTFFYETVFIEKTKEELSKEKFVKFAGAAIFFLVPMAVNNLVDFNLALMVAAVEIGLVFVWATYERGKFEKELKEISEYE